MLIRAYSENDDKTFKDTCRKIAKDLERTESDTELSEYILVLIGDIKQTFSPMSQVINDGKFDKSKYSKLSKKTNECWNNE